MSGVWVSKDAEFYADFKNKNLTYLSKILLLLIHISHIMKKIFDPNITA
jgi:hypothetical protein